MRRFKIILFSLLCVALVGVLGFEAYAISDLGENGVAGTIYSSNEILSIYRDKGDTKYTKYGVNATLKSETQNIESSSLLDLLYYLENSDPNGNAGIKRVRDDYFEAPIYKDIEIVNIDVETGELVGSLKDINYNFEWFGREITLKEGTTLLSGRTLTGDETFTVDVYTKFPSLYALRYLEGEREWISISPKPFKNAKLYDEFYLATFESTIFNPDGSVAKNRLGVIPRSYLYTFTPFFEGSSTYLSEYYNFEYTKEVKSSKLLFNLYTSWQNSVRVGDFKYATMPKGQDFSRIIYNILYLVKYLDPVSTNVLEGVTKTKAAYENTILPTPSGREVGENVKNYSLFEGAKGGGNIAVHSDFDKNRGVYNNRYLTSTGYDAAGMNYGYNVDKTFNGKKGIYEVQFLTYNDGEKNLFYDGFVGTNGYTGFFMLGVANPWGNLFEEIEGISVDTHNTTNLVFENDGKKQTYEIQSGSFSCFSTLGEEEFGLMLVPQKEEGNIRVNIEENSNQKAYFGGNCAGSFGGIFSIDIGNLVSCLRLKLYKG